MIFLREKTGLAFFIESVYYDEYSWFGNKTN